MRRVRIVLSAVIVAVGAICLPATAQATFGISNFEVQATNEGGWRPTCRRAPIPARSTTTIDLNLEGGTPASPAAPSAKATSATSTSKLPAGLIENPAARPGVQRRPVRHAALSPFETEPLRRELPRQQPGRGDHPAHLLAGGIAAASASSTSRRRRASPPRSAPAPSACRSRSLPASARPEANTALTLDLAQLPPELRPARPRTDHLGDALEHHPQRRTRQLPERGRTGRSLGQMLGRPAEGQSRRRPT